MNLNDFWLNPKIPVITPFSLLFSFGMFWSSIFSGLYSNNKKSWESLYEMIPENQETNIRPEEKGKEEENNYNPLTIIVRSAPLGALSNNDLKNI